mgnify:CR=1 FL=1
MGWQGDVERIVKKETLSKPVKGEMSAGCLDASMFRIATTRSANRSKPSGRQTHASQSTTNDVTVSGRVSVESRLEAKLSTTIVLILGNRLRVSRGDLANEGGLVLCVSVASWQFFDNKGNALIVSMS